MYRQVEESQTLLINTQSKLMEAEDKRVIKFGFGQSPFLPPRFVIDALIDSVEHKEYTSVQGDLELRKRMSSFHRQHNGLEVKPEHILVAPGSKILLFTILLSHELADVFIPVPAWVSYAPQAKLAGHNTIRLETTFEEWWRVTSNTLRDSIEKKKHNASILILNYPGNPDGLTYTEEELVDIATVARDNDMLIISDEIYGLLDHNLAHLSMVNYYPEKTITTTGLSKWCGAGGWRLGAAFLYSNIAPEFKQALIGIGSETYSCAPTPVQLAAREAYKDYDLIADYINGQVEILKKLGRFCAELLNKSNIRVHPPQGGFYLFPDFSLHEEALNALGIGTSQELCNVILAETGVALLPASAFGFDDQVLAARLAYVDFIEPSHLDEFDLQIHGNNIIEGIERIARWTEKRCGG